MEWREHVVSHLVCSIVVPPAQFASKPANAAAHGTLWLADPAPSDVHVL